MHYSWCGGFHKWGITGFGDASIQGFATDISVNKAETVHFKIKTTATNYRLDIYRMGYYQNKGARKVDTVQVSLSQAQTQPSCTPDTVTAPFDCGNWSESASWTVPTNAVSGIYFARLVRTDTNGASHIFFIVRDDNGGSDLLFQTSDTTWQAYNFYDVNNNGKSLYAQRAYKVSYNRPFHTGMGGTQFSWVFNAEYPMVRWLEANGYSVSYTTGVDSSKPDAVDKIAAIRFFFQLVTTSTGQENSEQMSKPHGTPASILLSLAETKSIGKCVGRITFALWSVTRRRTMMPPKIRSRSHYMDRHMA